MREGTVAGRSRSNGATAHLKKQECRVLKQAGLIFLVLAGAGLITLGAAMALLQYRPPQEALSFTSDPPVEAADDLSWTVVGGDPGQSRFSTLDQITPRNVGRVKEVWRYSTGEVKRRGAAISRSKFQATPILSAGNLVFCTPFNRVIALDPQSGVQRWVFDAEVDTIQPPANDYNCRGLAQWRDPFAPDPTQTCAQRLFMATNDRRLIALDARTGARCSAFGTKGQIKVIDDEGLITPGEVQFVAVPAVSGDVVIVGSSVADNFRANAPNGSVRAFNARTGKLVWTFDPTPDAQGRTGGGNVWSSITVDQSTNTVFMPTSSPSPDFFGGEREGSEALTNSIVALRGATGEVLWSFQVVHHDLWDYDVPAGPSLFNLRRDGTEVPALAFATKQGFVFVLDRRSGQPLFPVVERPVPPSDVQGERASRTQPFSTLPPVAPQQVGPKDAFGLTPIDRSACERELAERRNEGLFTPPSIGGTIFMPTTGGGANWGGVAIDLTRNRLIVNTSRAAEVITLVPRSMQAAGAWGAPEGDASVKDSRYDVRREVLLSPLGLPCTRPPWGALTAIDLDEGKRAWEVPLGTTSTLAPFGIALPWGTPNLGGAVLTRGGLVFIGAAMDNRLRAFSTETGQELWAADLPAGGQASPMTYSVGNRQYVVIAAGGHSVLGTTRGDSVVAFALP
jgi:quinoprotein glucose dehydrogenase